MQFLKSIKLNGLLSFPPESPAVELTPLNVLIGPNASGKSNLLEAIELLHATPTALAAAIREGGTAAEWLWKGEPIAKEATAEAVVHGKGAIPDLRYRLSFVPSTQRMEVVDEAIEETAKRYAGEQDVYFYYRFQHGRPAINTVQATTTTTPPPVASTTSTTTTTTTTPPPTPPGVNRGFRQLTRDSVVPDESVLSQRKDADLYPELFWLGNQFSRIQTFRDWNFGRAAPLRRPQKTDLPTDELLGNSENLGLVLNELQHSNASAEFNRLMSRFLPRYQRFSTRIQGNTVQFYLHEEGLRTPVPATRLSDGTIRFMAILALLLSPSPPPLLCIEEPELGEHPDAVNLFADLLVSASERMQLIVTTHSDALVSALTEHASSVLVCDYLGGTVLRRVDASKLSFWLEKYRLGEIWRIGELGGNP
jgi:predicted ATPase